MTNNFPTRFFNRLTSNVDESEDYDEADQPQTAEARDIQVFWAFAPPEACCRKCFAGIIEADTIRSLQYPNHEFYEDKLYIVTEPLSASGSLGLKFNHVPEGVYDRGASRTNRVEAKAVWSRHSAARSRGSAKESWCRNVFNSNRGKLSRMSWNCSGGKTLTLNHSFRPTLRNLSLSRILKTYRVTSATWSSSP